MASRVAGRLVFNVGTGTGLLLGAAVVTDLFFDLLIEGLAVMVAAIEVDAEQARNDEQNGTRSEDVVEGKGVDPGGRRILKKKQ